jgi:hypothetical protein
VITPFEVVAILGAFCGTAMVVGGIWLVAKGVITLAATPQAQALTIEWKRQFRINTQVPGLAFFIVGMLFISISLRFLQPDPVLPVELVGELRGMDQPWLLSIRPQNSWEQRGSATRTFSTKIYPEVSSLVIEVTAPGYEPFEKSIPISGKTKRLENIGILELRRKVVKADISQSVATLPFQVEPPGPEPRPSFGAAR